ncbi:MAG: hypothetical protein ACJ8C3_19465 [Microvirga sp.]
MVRRAIVALIVLLVPALAEARGGRGFSIGLRGSTKSAAHSTQPSPKAGAGVGVVIPVSRRASEPSPESAAGGGAAPPGVVSPAAATAAAVEPVQPRPWCEGGQLVGGLLRAELIRRHGRIVAERLQSRR